MVGGGPTGVALATRLAGLGASTLVVDRAPAVYGLPRAVAADDEVQQILELLAPGIVADMLPDQQVRFLDAGRRPLGTVTFAASAAGYSGLSFFSQPDLERSLRTALLAAGAELRLGVAVTSFSTHASGVTAELSDREQVQAGWLVGCDGSGSFVRSAAGIAWRGRDLADEWLIVDAVGEVPDRRLFSYTCDPAMPQVDLPVPGGHRWEWLLRGPAPASALELIGRDTDASVQVVRQTRYRFAARRAEEWVAGRVALAGDAAHTMPPFAGQGLGAGIRDAWALAQRIVDGTVDGYQAQRAPHVARMTRLSLLLGGVLQARHGAPVRDAVLRQAFAAPGLGGWLSRGGPRVSASGVLD